MSDVQIVAVRAFDDNYVWLLIVGNRAIAIDAGDAKPVQDYLVRHQLQLEAMLITHHHHDHTGGVTTLKNAYPNAKIFAHQAHGVPAEIVCDEGSQFELLGIDFTVWRTAGHTDTHLSYLCQIDGKTHVFCGDTLFSGGCGRVFTGTMSELFDSMNRFDTLPADTLFFPAHEYTLSNLMFGLSLCGERTKIAIEQAINATKQTLAQGGISLPTSLQAQRDINVFLQTKDADLIANVDKRYPLADKSPLAVFTALRTLKNQA